MTQVLPSTALIAYEELLTVTAAVFAAEGVPPARAQAAAEALCYGDLTGMSSHGLTNLTRLYLPSFRDGRVDPVAEPEVIVDRGACALVDTRRALGLWSAAEMMDLAVDRAQAFGVGLVSVRGATHFGCAGHHTARAARRGMVGLLAANCGRQRIARPPGGRVAMLGTNPLSVAAPVGDRHPFVLDMSTTAVPTGRVRAAARADEPVPPGWLADDAGNPVTDAAAFDRGDAHLLWLGGSSGAHKGFGLGLVVEVLAALLPGAGLGPEPQALRGHGGPSGRDDDIGFLALAIAPDLVRPDGNFPREAQSLFDTILACPAVPGAAPVRYPGWHEGERAQRRRRTGIPVDRALVEELASAALERGVRAPRAMEVA